MLAIFNFFPLCDFRGLFKFFFNPYFLSQIWHWNSFSWVLTCLVMSLDCLQHVKQKPVLVSSSDLIASLLLLIFLHHYHAPETMAFFKKFKFSSTNNFRIWTLFVMNFIVGDAYLRTIKKFKAIILSIKKVIR